MKVEEESENLAKNSTSRKLRSSTITSWQREGETMKTVRDFILGVSKFTADNDCSHEIKRHLLLGRKAMTTLDSILKSRDITLLTEVHTIKVSFSSSHVQTWELDNKKGRTRKNWCPWTVVLEETPLNSKEIKPINPKENQPLLFTRTDPEAPIFGHLMRRADSLEKILMLGKIEGRRRRQQSMRWWWMASPTQWTWVREMVKDSESWHAAVHGVAELDTPE